MRKAAVLFMILASLTFYTFAVTAPASADPGGNNGDVKIHRTGTAITDHRDEPQVCSFYIDGFNFDAGSTGTWRIERWAPTGSGMAASGTWGTADADGDWHSDDQTLPDGHYKLFVQQTAPAAPGGEKQKVFWVDCATSTIGSSTGNSTGNSTGSSTGSATGSSTGNSTGSATGSSTGNSTGSATGSSTGNSTGSATGSSTGNSTGSATGTTTGTATGNSTGNSTGTAVAGVQTPPANGVGSVSPIIEVPGTTAVNGVQGPATAAVNGVQGAATAAVNGLQGAGQVAGVQGLPSTSTNSNSPAIPLASLGIALIAMGGLIVRRGQIRA